MSEPYADVEDALVVLLAHHAPGNTDTVIPTPIADRLPFVRVYRYGGRDDGISDSAAVTVDVFAATRAVGVVLAERIRQELLDGPHFVATEEQRVVFDAVTTAGAPHEVPFGDSGVRQFTADYRVTARRPLQR